MEKPEFNRIFTSMMDYYDQKKWPVARYERYWHKFRYLTAARFERLCNKIMDYFNTFPSPGKIEEVEEKTPYAYSNETPVIERFECSKCNGVGHFTILQKKLDANFQNTMYEVACRCDCANSHRFAQTMPTFNQNWLAKIGLFIKNGLVLEEASSDKAILYVKNAQYSPLNGKAYELRGMTPLPDDEALQRLYDKYVESNKEANLPF